MIIIVIIYKNHKSHVQFINLIKNSIFFYLSIYFHIYPLPPIKVVGKREILIFARCEIGGKLSFPWKRRTPKINEPEAGARQRESFRTQTRRRLGKRSRCLMMGHRACDIIIICKSFCCLSLTIYGIIIEWVMYRDIAVMLNSMRFRVAAWK